MMKEEPPGPHGKHWVDLLYVDWSKSFAALADAAREIGADAILEVYCGMGLNYVVKEYDSPRFVIISSDVATILDPREEKPEEERSKCILSGLAVKWKE